MWVNGIPYRVVIASLSGAVIAIHTEFKWAPNFSAQFSTHDFGIDISHSGYD
jgi:hypothetical protein